MGKSREAARRGCRPPVITAFATISGAICRILPCILWIQGIILASGSPVFGVAQETVAKQQIVAVFDQTCKDLTLQRGEMTLAKVRLSTPLLAGDRLKVPATRKVTMTLMNGERVEVHGRAEVRFADGNNLTAIPRTALRRLQPVPQALMRGRTYWAETETGGVYSRNAGWVIAPTTRSDAGQAVHPFPGTVMVVGWGEGGVGISWVVSNPDAETEVKIFTRHGTGDSAEERLVVVRSMPPGKAGYMLDRRDLTIGIEYYCQVSEGEKQVRLFRFRLASPMEREEWKVTRDYSLTSDPVPDLPDLLRLSLYEKYGLWAQAKALCDTLLLRMREDAAAQEFLKERASLYADALRYPTAVDISPTEGTDAIPRQPL